MAIKFDKILGCLRELDESTGGGTGDTIITGHSTTYANLPTASSHTGEYYIVDTNTGTWILGTLKKAGLYKSNGSTWVYIDNVPETTSLSDGTTVITGTNIILEGGTEITTTTNVGSNKITFNSTGYTKTELDGKFDLKQEVFVGVCAKHPILPADIVIDNTTRTLTIATVNGTAVSSSNPICYYTDGNGKSAKHLQITPAVFNWEDTTGVWYLYFDTNGSAIASQTAWSDFGVIAPIARFYWNATLATADKLQVYAYEAHQNTISSEDHNWKHAQGTIWQRGMDLKHTALASGAPNASGINTCVGLTNGVNIDDNLSYSVMNSTSSGSFYQDLGEILPANITVSNGGLLKVRSNDSLGRLTVLPATRFPFPWDTATNRPEYITIAGVRTIIPNGDFFVVYIYAFQDPRTGEPLKVTTTPASYGTITLARASSWSEMQGYYPTLADNEIRPMYKIIFEHRTSYSSTVKYSVLREVLDIRKTIVASTTAGGSVLASSVSLVPVGNIASTNVQSAIEELDLEKSALSGAMFTGAISATNLSNTNTGDETAGGIKTKLEILTGTNRLDATAIKNSKTSQLTYDSGITTLSGSALISSANVPVKITGLTATEDTYSLFNATTQRVVIKTAGTYQITGRIDSGTYTGVGILSCYINGTINYGSLYAAAYFPTAAGTRFFIGYGTPIVLNVGDYIEFYIQIGTAPFTIYPVLAILPVI